MSEDETIDQPRRRFVGTAAMTIAAAELGVITSAAAQTGKAAANGSRPGTVAQNSKTRQRYASGWRIFYGLIVVAQLARLLEGFRVSKPIRSQMAVCIGPDLYS